MSRRRPDESHTNPSVNANDDAQHGNQLQPAMLPLLILPTSCYGRPHGCHWHKSPAGGITVGVLSAQGLTCSNCDPSLKRVASSPRRAAKCTPIRRATSGPMQRCRHGRLTRHVPHAGEGAV